MNILNNNDKEKHNHASNNGCDLKPLIVVCAITSWWLSAQQKQKAQHYLLCAVTCQRVGQVGTEGALPHSSFPRQHKDLVFDCR